MLALASALYVVAVALHVTRRGSLQNRDTALLLACKSGHVDIVMWLVRNGYSDALLERRPVCWRSANCVLLLVVHQDLRGVTERQHGTPGGLSQGAPQSCAVPRGRGGQLRGIRTQ